MDRVLEDDDIVMEILKRLPLRSLMRCSCVCNRWRNLAREPQFIHSHLMNRSAQENPGLILQTHWGKLYFLEHSHNHNHNQEETLHDDDYTFTELRLSPDLIKHAILLGSCNGLCLIHRSEDCYLFNPITGSHLRLPDLINPPKFRWQTRIEFGFNTESINEYKAVAVYTCDNRMQSEVFVHTVGGDGCWRDIGCVPYVIERQLGNKYSCMQVFLCGALHWICSCSCSCSSPAAIANNNNKNNLIVSFNIANEVFEVIPLPPEITTASDTCFSLAVLGGCLSISNFSILDQVELWIMKEYGVKESWTKIFSTKLLHEDARRINGDYFYMDVFFNSRPLTSNVKSLCLQKNGQLLMLDHLGILQSFNPQTMALRKLNIDNSLSYWYQAFTHVGSLVSFRGSSV